MVRSLQFFVVYTTFFLFITQIVGLMAQDLAVDSPITVPSINMVETPPTGVLDMIDVFISNIGFFFELMTLNSSFFLFGSIIVTPFIVGVVWALIYVIKDIIPLT